MCEGKFKFIPKKEKAKAVGDPNGFTVELYRAFWIILDFMKIAEEFYVHGHLNGC